MTLPLLLLAVTAPRDHVVERIDLGPDRPFLVLAPRSTNTATLILRFDVGSYDDGQDYGLTRLTQLALLQANGATTYERIGWAIYTAGASLRVETEAQTCSFSLTAPVSQFPALADMIVSMVLTPRLQQAGFDSARARVPLSSGRNEILGLFAQAVFPDARFQVGPGGTEALDNVRVDQVARHAKKYFSPANATIIVAGGFDRTSATRLARHRGGSRVSRSPPTLVGGRHEEMTWFELHVVGYPVEPRDAQSVAALHLLATIASDRLTRVFRRQGVGYAVEARTVRRPWITMLMLTLPIHASRNIGAAEKLTTEMRSIGSGPLKPGEFDRNRSFLMAELDRANDDSVALAELLSMTDRGLSLFDDSVVQQVRDLGEPQFHEITRSWLDPSSSVHVQFAPYTSKDGVE